MSLRSKIMVRSLARRLGILAVLRRLIGWWRSISGKAYEVDFDRELEAMIRPGDTVWDVGANLGHYTERFADLVGSGGEVHGFEPMPTCFRSLTERVGQRPNVTLHEVALGDVRMKMAIVPEQDPLGSTHSLVGEPSDGHASLDVQVWDGEGYRQDLGLAVPQVIKVDVEGFELEVLRGIDQILADGACRAVGVEVHFAVLERRGARDAPVTLVSLLEGHGFEVSWTDASHVVAVRDRVRSGEGQ